MRITLVLLGVSFLILVVKDLVWQIRLGRADEKITKIWRELMVWRLNHPDHNPADWESPAELQKRLARALEDYMMACEHCRIPI